jgi:hypothetical protein
MTRGSEGDLTRVSKLSGSMTLSHLNDKASAYTSPYCLKLTVLSMFHLSRAFEYLQAALEPD